MTLAAVGAAGALVHSQAPLYKSQAVVAVQPAAVAASSGNPPNMATEEGIVTSGAVLARASSVLGVPMAVTGQRAVGDVPGTTTLLQIAYSAPGPAHRTAASAGDRTRLTFLPVLTADRGPRH